LALDHPVQPFPWSDLLNADRLDDREASLGALERALAHRFAEPGLLSQALTHAGHGHGRAGAIDNERLEFLGDRVLGLVIAELLMEIFPDAREGELGPRLTVLVRREALAEVAAAIDLGGYLALAPADAAAGARSQPKLLADACEAVIAALYLDGGLPAAKRFIVRHWQSLLRDVAAMPIEPKTSLQEWAQGQGRPLPIYTVVRSSGKAHAPEFAVEVEVSGLQTAIGTGLSKRAAEKAAATILLRRLGVLPAEPEA
jgi:ribonuclease-3